MIQHPNVLYNQNIDTKNDTPVDLPYNNNIQQGQIKHSNTSVSQAQNQVKSVQSQAGFKSQIILQSQIIPQQQLYNSRTPSYQVNDKNFSDKQIYEQEMNRGRNVIHRFLQTFQALKQKFSQPLSVQKQSGVTYPFLLPIYNNYFYIHVGPNSIMPDISRPEKLNELAKNAQRMLIEQHYQHYYQPQMYSVFQENKSNQPSQAQQKSQITLQKSIFQTGVKLEENEENFQQQLPISMNQRSAPIFKFQETQKRPEFKFTSTPYLSQIDLKEEANKIRQRYINRQEGNVKKRIRKTKEEIQIDLRDGKDPKETKNIPKNYAKAIMTYLLKNESLIDKYNSDPKFKEGFLKFLQTMKLAIQNIKQFKAMLSDQELCPIQQEYNKIFRIISRYFLKNHAVAYIFNSRITQKSWHIKYRTDLLQAVKNPLIFRKVKPKKRLHI